MEVGVQQVLAGKFAHEDGFLDPCRERRFAAGCEGGRGQLLNGGGNGILPRRTLIFSLQEGYLFYFRGEHTLILLMKVSYSPLFCFRA